LKMYVVIYAGKTNSGKVFDTSIRELRNFVFKTVGESKDTVEIISGGRQKVVHADVFFLGRNYPAPVPMPYYPE